MSDLGPVVPISIGTAIAVQSIMGLDAEGAKLKRGPLGLEYDSLYLNLRTLIRNFIGANKQLQPISAESIYYGVQSDVSIIINVMLGQLPGVRVIPYVCLFNDLSAIFNQAVWREANTPLQKEAKELEDAVLKLFVPTVQAGHLPGYVIFNTRLNRVMDNRTTIVSLPRKSLIITHLPIDLLSAGYFTKLMLLESHTGALKPPSEWNTKLKNFKEEYKRIPFNTMTIQLFGDTGDMFKGVASTKFKKRLVELSVQYKWNPTTTRDRMVLAARLSNEPDMMKDMHRYSTKF